MKSRIDCRWLEDMAFEAEINDHVILMDADEMMGGQNRGPRPKPLTLASLAGCSGMDVISILRKMRVEPEGFHIMVEGNLTEEHPRYYDHIRLIYCFKGKDLPADKLQKAVELSQDRYCGVSALLKKGAELEWEIRTED